MSDILRDQPAAATDATDQSEPATTVDQAMEALGDSSFPPVIILLSFPLAVTQIGQSAIVTTFVGLIIAAVAIQMLLSWHHLHLPKFLRELPARGPVWEKILRGVSLMTPDSEKMRRQLGYWMTLPPFGVLPKLIILVCAVVLPLSSYVYGLTNILAFAIVLLSMGLLTRQGIWILVGASCVSLASVLPAIVA